MVYKRILLIALMFILPSYPFSLGQSADDEYQPGLLQEVEKRESVAAEEKQPNMETEEERLGESKDRARIGEIQEEKDQAMERIAEEGEYNYGNDY